MCEFQLFYKFALLPLTVLITKKLFYSEKNRVNFIFLMKNQTVFSQFEKCNLANLANFTQARSLTAPKSLPRLSSKTQRGSESSSLSSSFYIATTAAAAKKEKT